MGKRGALIVFEGLDRTGKSTQAKLLVDRLLAAENGDGGGVLLKYPDRDTQIGKMIDEYLQTTRDIEDHAIHLLFSANRWESRQKILDLIAQGTTVVVDRYMYSGIAFSAAKGLSIDYCRAPDQGLPRPDLVIYLTADSSNRDGFGDERYETRDFQTQVRKVFDLQALMNLNMTFEDFLDKYPLNNDVDNTPWVTLDASKSIKEIANQVNMLVDKLTQHLPQSLGTFT